MLIQLFEKNCPTREMIASDGRMWVDGRLNYDNILDEIAKRNSAFRKNFPHKVAALRYTVIRKR